MRVTKYVHSCLLVEEKNQRILIDPGRYSWDSHLIDLEKIGSLSHIVITHEHGDHYFEPALKMIATYSPHAQIITNNDLAENLKDLNLPNPVTAGSGKNIVVFEAPHEPLPFKTAVPLNVGIHIGNKLTHPGDALKIKTTREVLALPVSAPSWTSLKIALEKAAKLKPKKVLPIHDWHWHERAREEVYEKINDWLKLRGIELIALENTKTVEL